MTAGRRAFLELAGASVAGLAAFAVLGRAFVAPPVPVGADPASDAERLNVALNMAYLNAQFHAHAVKGKGLADAILDGVGRRGDVRGARKLAFFDPQIAQYAREIAADSAAHVVALRRALGTAAAAQPAIDLTRAFAGDDAFLRGGYLVGNDMPAAIRMLMLGTVDAGARGTLSEVLADVIYRQGLIGALTTDARPVITEKGFVAGGWSVLRGFFPRGFNGLPGSR